MLRTVIQIVSVPITGWTLYRDSVLSPHRGTPGGRNGELLLYRDRFLSLVFAKVSALLSGGHRTGQGHGKKQLEKQD